MPEIDAKGFRILEPQDPDPPPEERFGEEEGGEEPEVEESEEDPKMYEFRLRVPVGQQAGKRLLAPWKRRETYARYLAKKKKLDAAQKAEGAV